MKRPYLVAALLFGALAPVATAQPNDLGNIASDGSGGRQTLIRPLMAEDADKMWQFFPPFSDPPATPAQADTLLTAGTPLLLVLPQLQHFPSGAIVSVSDSISGNQINVDASLQFTGYVTATIYGPHEYLYPLGPLAAGSYHLVLNFSESFDTPQPQYGTTGYVDFVVHGVPEPSACLLLCCGAAVPGAFARRRPTIGHIARR